VINGSPTFRCPDERARTRAQTDRIRELLVAGMDVPPIAARVQCTLRRVQDMAASNHARRHRAPEETAR
jgi:hypothetical protein